MCMCHSTQEESERYHPSKGRNENYIASRDYSVNQGDYQNA